MYIQAASTSPLTSDQARLSPWMDQSGTILMYMNGSVRQANLNPLKAKFYHKPSET